jgi:hypothetical protein
MTGTERGGADPATLPPGQMTETVFRSDSGGKHPASDQARSRMSAAHVGLAGQRLSRPGLPGASARQVARSGSYSSRPNSSMSSPSRISE